MTGEGSAAIRDLGGAVAGDGGAVIGAYRDPLAGDWLLLAGLPIEQVEPTPYQRDLSEAHVKRLVECVDKVGVFLDPIIATREGERKYWTPNGGHRLAAMKKLGARAIAALLVPRQEIAFKILALNTEKSHNLKEKCLEVIRMAKAIARTDGRKESEFAFEFEEADYLTLGLCYEKVPRFAGGSYRPALRRVEEFEDVPLGKSLTLRAARAEKLVKLDERVGEIVKALRERGLTSPYLRAFVSARINPIRFAKTVSIGADELVKKMQALADKFDVAKVRQDQIAAVAAFGPPDEEA
jgi:ParB family chromosome partitioning protein